MIHGSSDSKHGDDAHAVDELLATYRLGAYSAGSKALGLPDIRASAFAALDT